ncbi:hypothetical protein E0Z10_g3186 [Xylaria hypoxylon]|uniref:Uncharacterized protein n=1 Tax=Xylaria hypoxylon TaxID=37992 RepID=A0A4Z0Z441_9PEZI|nr:hypothetical protein E0Z10_g3186 [Xylaria hypoxylon]
MMRYHAQPQYELFFQNTSHLVTGNNFRDRVTGIGGGFDSIDRFPILAHSKSRLITCWPYLVVQKPNGTLSEVNYIGQYPTQWQNYSLGIDAPKGTSLAILPLSRTYEAPYHAVLTVDIGGSHSSSFGAFAVAQENDPKNGTNIYILYQTESNDLEYVYYLGDSWELGASSDVLKNADPSTDITCLTESVWEGLAVMSSKYDMRDKRLFALFSYLSQKLYLAYNFQAITGKDGLFQLLAVQSGSADPGTEDRKLLFGKDYIDFDVAKDESDYNMWIKPNGRLVFANGDNEVCRDDRHVV